MAPQIRGGQIVKRKNIKTLGSLAMNTHTFLDDLYNVRWGFHNILDRSNCTRNEKVMSF
jgi:hypothetical protein